MESVGDYVSPWSKITHPGLGLWKKVAAIVVNSFLLWKWSPLLLSNFFSRTPWSAMSANRIVDYRFCVPCGPPFLAGFAMALLGSGRVLFLISVTPRSTTAGRAGCCGEALVIAGYDDRSRDARLPAYNRTPPSLGSCRLEVNRVLQRQSDVRVSFKWSGNRYKTKSFAPNPGRSHVNVSITSRSHFNTSTYK